MEFNELKSAFEKLKKQFPTIKEISFSENNSEQPDQIEIVCKDFNPKEEDPEQIIFSKILPKSPDREYQSDAIELYQPVFYKEYNNTDKQVYKDISDNFVGGGTHLLNHPYTQLTPLISKKDESTIYVNIILRTTLYIPDSKINQDDLLLRLTELLGFNYNATLDVITKDLKGILDQEEIENKVKQYNEIINELLIAKTEEKSTL